MDIFDEDLISFWKSLNKESIKYIMIGGFAVNLHGFSRTTADVDLWLEDEILNRKKFAKAIAQYGYDEETIIKTDFIPGWVNFNIGNGITLDIIIQMKGLENISFDEAYAHAAVAEIFDVKVPFLHINELIQNKRATNRSKDLIDVIELEKIVRLRSEQNKKN